VNRFPENPRRQTGPFTRVAIIILLAALLFPPAVPAGTLAPENPDSPDRKIRITADRLVADTKNGSADFIGNVRASQGSTLITSDRLKVIYDQNAENASAEDAKAAIKAIISSGTVVIHFNNKVATTEKAVYNSQTGILTLTGKGTRVTSGDNSITGEKITVDRKKDRMTVESSEDTRVNAVIFTGRDGLAPSIPSSGTEEK